MWSPQHKTPLGKCKQLAGPPHVKSKDEGEMHKGKMWVLIFKDMLETSWLDRVPSPCASAERSVDKGAHSGMKTKVSDHGGP